MSSKLSYRSALLVGVKPTLNLNAQEFVPEHIKNPPTTFWDTPEKGEPEFYTWKDKKYENPTYPRYKTFTELRSNPVFKKKFAIFAENILCITNVDTMQGLRFNPPYWGSDNYKDWKGQKKKYVGLHLEYKQDGIVYRIAYECDDLEDPGTGWFMQWFHKEDCGGSCDYYGCYHNYKAPKGYKPPALKTKQQAFSATSININI